jgi:glycosyltransferase involved in cell wall biosynthesis
LTIAVYAGREKLALGSNERLKAVVALAGARDGYQLPLALSEADLLEALVTDVYWPSDKRWFNTSLGKTIPDHLLRARFCVGLDSRNVRVSVGAWALSICGHVAPPLGMNPYGDRMLSRKAKSIALRKSAAMFCCSYYAYEAFREDDERPHHRFIFQLHPHPKTVRNILLEEIERTPIAAFSLEAEPDLSLTKKSFDELSREPHLANGWVVASTFTAQTLSENGIPYEQIHVVPYGVDDCAFAERLRPPLIDKPFTIIFVGSLVQRKGLSYLLDAVRLISSRTVRVVLCGRGLLDRDLIDSYSDLNIEVNAGLDREALVREIHKADVFVLPSLVEGFGHVILEAMSCGIPVIATPHTCAPDVIVDGVHGFIVPIRDPEAIAERLSWGVDHREELASMGEAAAARARRFSWERFRVALRKAYREMLACVP